MGDVDHALAQVAGVRRALQGQEIERRLVEGEGVLRPDGAPLDELVADAAHMAAPMDLDGILTAGQTEDVADAVV